MVTAALEKQLVSVQSTPWVTAVAAAAWVYNGTTKVTGNTISSIINSSAASACRMEELITLSSGFEVSRR